jgi:hypothetical protein
MNGPRHRKNLVSADVRLPWLRGSLPRATSAFETRVFPNDPEFSSDVAEAVRDLNSTAQSERFVEALRVRLAGRYPLVRVKAQNPLATLTGNIVVYVFRDGSVDSARC